MPGPQPLEKNWRYGKTNWTCQDRFVRTPENTQKFRVNPWALAWGEGNLKMVGNLCDVFTCSHSGAMIDSVISKLTGEESSGHTEAKKPAECGCCSCRVLRGAWKRWDPQMHVCPVSTRQEMYFSWKWNNSQEKSVAEWSSLNNNVFPLNCVSQSVCH